MNEESAPRHVVVGTLPDGRTIVGTDENGRLLEFREHRGAVAFAAGLVDVGLLEATVGTLGAEEAEAILARHGATPPVVFEDEVGFIPNGESVNVARPFGKVIGCLMLRGHAVAHPG